MHLTIEFADGRTEEIRPTPADLIRFERNYTMAAAKVDDDPRTEYVMYLAWCVQTRTGRTDLEFDDWLDTLAELRDDDEAATTAHPLPPPG